MCLLLRKWQRCAEAPWAATAALKKPTERQQLALGRNSKEGNFRFIISRVLQLLRRLFAREVNMFNTLKMLRIQLSNLE